MGESESPNPVHPKFRVPTLPRAEMGINHEGLPIYRAMEKTARDLFGSDIVVSMPLGAAIPPQWKPDREPGFFVWTMLRGNPSAAPESLASVPKWFSLHLEVAIGDGGPMSVKFPGLEIPSPGVYIEAFPGGVSITGEELQKFKNGPELKIGVFRLWTTIDQATDQPIGGENFVMLTPEDRAALRPAFLQLHTRLTAEPPTSSPEGPTKPFTTGMGF